MRAAVIQSIAVIKAARTARGKPGPLGAAKHTTRPAVIDVSFESSKAV